MSRNRGERECAWCGGAIDPDEPRVYDAGGLVNATCGDCGAQYLAYMDGESVDDTSFRSTWNDEPGLADFPKFAIRRGIVERIPWSNEVAQHEKYSGQWNYAWSRLQSACAAPADGCARVTDVAAGKCR